MGFLAWIILGLIVGAIVKAVMPGRVGGGWVTSLVLGVVGAIVGGWIGSLLFGNEAQGLSEAELALADHRVAVPVYGAAESLNLGTAATVCLYASARSQQD